VGIEEKNVAFWTECAVKEKALLAKVTPAQLFSVKLSFMFRRPQTFSVLVVSHFIAENQTICVARSPANAGVEQSNRIKAMNNFVLVLSCGRAGRHPEP
jgi:hypothetical protein